ncbi:MAG: hypothetical protein SNJ84_00040 [Verrucomicrobiia bacterium]
MEAPVISCPRCPALPAGLAEAARLLAGRSSCRFGQPWAEAVEGRFRPGSVALAWDGDQLGVWADLDDDDVFNEGSDSTQPLWALGDVFEMFLRPLPGERYVELHVTPENVQLRLAFPSELFFWREAMFYGRKPWVWNHALGEEAFGSEASRRDGGWQVWARIPWATLTGGTVPGVGEVWSGCFCRYDATRGETEPVLSTTGAHRRRMFHDQRGWNRIEFEG